VVAEEEEGERFVVVVVVVRTDLLLMAMTTTTTRVDDLLPQMSENSCSVVVSEAMEEGEVEKRRLAAPEVDWMTTLIV
jgi:hypothetical protein